MIKKQVDKKIIRVMKHAILENNYISRAHLEYERDEKFRLRTDAKVKEAYFLPRYSSSKKLPMRVMTKSLGFEDPLSGEEHACRIWHPCCRT